MLSAYLIGLGVGSAVMSRYVGKIKSPLAVFGMMEVANAIIGLLSLQVFLTLGMREPAAKYSYALIWGLSDFWRLAIYSALIIVPVTLLYGAIFPVAVRLVGEGHRYSEEAIGRLYAYNTVGGILGSAATGFMLIPLLGTTMAFVSMSVVSLLIGIYLLIKSSAIEPFSRQKLCIYAGVLAMTLAVSFSFKDPFLTVLMKRFGGQGSRLVAHREDPGATLTVFEDKERTLYINGLYVSNTSPNIGELMVNLPLAFNSEPGPKKVLVIGMGVGSALRYGTDVGHHITNVELHPGVVELFKQFNPDHQQYLENPKNKIVFNDGRNFLFNTEEKFDLILVDGSPPFYAAGMVNLYSLNFARLAKAHLTDSGVFAIWLPIVCFESDVWMVIKNFSETFESIKLYTPKGGSNGILMGNAKKGHFSEDFNQFAQQLSRWGDAGLATPMMQGMTFSEEELRKRAAPYSTVTDNHPHTEFPLQNFLRGEPYYADNRFLFEP